MDVVVYLKGALDQLDANGGGQSGLCCAAGGLARRKTGRTSKAKARFRPTPGGVLLPVFPAVVVRHHPVERHRPSVDQRPHRGVDPLGQAVDPGLGAHGRVPADPVSPRPFARPPLSSGRRRVASMASQEIEPARISAGGSTETSTTVEPTPPGAGPPSMT